MEAKIDAQGCLTITTTDDTESFALKQWWNGFFTKDGLLRANRTTEFSVDYKDDKVDNRGK